MLLRVLSPVVSRRVPRRNPRKRAVLGLAVLLAAGCGGGSTAPQEQIVRGTGYHFAAPADWKVVRSGREIRVSDGIPLVSVARYDLLRAFRSPLWDHVVPELDRAAKGLAEQQDGSVVESATATIAGGKARTYDIAYEREGKALVERIGFVLRGKSEYLLLCRYERGGDTEACDGLLTSFKLAAA
jgi:hypothetical protein